MKTESVFQLLRCVMSIQEAPPRLRLKVDADLNLSCSATPIKFLR